MPGDMAFLKLRMLAALGEALAIAQEYDQDDLLICLECATVHSGRPCPFQFLILGRVTLTGVGPALCNPMAPYRVPVDALEGRMDELKRRLEQEAGEPVPGACVLAEG